MSVRLCGKSGKHAGRLVEAFCLEEGCRRDRLLCFFCVFESHTSHQIAYLHRELGGAISNLDHQALTVTTEAVSSKERLETTFMNISRACDRLGKAASSKLNMVKSKLAPQIQAIRKSFRRNSVDEILKDLTSSHHITNDKLDKYANILRYYHSNSLSDLPKLERNSLIVLETFSQLVDEASRKIELVFNDLVAFVSKFDLTIDLPSLDLGDSQPQPAMEIEDRKVEEILEEKVKANMEALTKQEDIKALEGVADSKEEGEVDDQSPEKKAQPKSEKQVQPESELQMPVQINCQNAIEQNSDTVQIKQGEVFLQEKPVLTTESQKPASSEMIQQSIIQEEKEEGIIDQIKTAGGTQMDFKQKQPQQDEESESKHSQWQPAKVGQVEKKQRSMRNAPPHVERVQIYATSPHELNRMLKKIDPLTIRQLTVRCDTRLCAINEDSVKIISQMTKLTSLKVYFAKTLSDMMAIDLIRKLEKLQELVLAQFSHLTPRFMEVIKTYNTQLTRICFSIDMENLRIIEESLEFLPDITEGLRSQTSLQILTDSGFMLSNLQLQNAVNQSYWVNYIRTSSDILREVSITQKEHHTKFDYTFLINSLRYCTRLERLRLEMLEFEEEALVQVLKNNPKLQVFMVSECPCVTMRTYRTLFKQATHLKTLSITIDDQFTAKFPKTPENLEILVLRGCLQINESNFVIMIQELKKLKCVSINFADWLGRGALWGICNLKALQILNLNDNPNCLSPFASNDLKLKTMISNNLSYKGFAERSCGNFMKRLAISAVPKGDGDDEKTKEEVLDLSALHRQFPKLTHLKILNYKRVHDAGKIEGFPYLISLVVKGLRKEDTEGLQAWCQRRRITFLCVDP